VGTKRRRKEPRYTSCPLGAVVGVGRRARRPAAPEGAAGVLRLSWRSHARDDGGVRSACSRATTVPVRASLDESPRQRARPRRSVDVLVRVAPLRARRRVTPTTIAHGIRARSVVVALSWSR
jgi:hypothetical protein